MPDVSIRTAAGATLTVEQLYQIWQIRDSVFAVEQHVTEVDADGQDLRDDTTHMWCQNKNRITSYLRVMADARGYRIGRVCTRPDNRGCGLAGALIRYAHGLFDHKLITLSAQTYLEAWYYQLGYRRSGKNFTEAGIEHVPMLFHAP